MQLTSPAATVATLEALEVQVAVAVTFLVAPEAKVPIAVSWNLPPAGISHSLEGTIVMYLSCAAWQVTPIDVLMLPLVAVMVEEPFMVAPAVQLTTPVADTVATLATLELQTTVLVTSCAGPEE